MLPFFDLDKLCSQAAQKAQNRGAQLSLSVSVARVRKMSTITYHEHDCREAIDGSTVLTMSGVAIS